MFRRYFLIVDRFYWLIIKIQWHVAEAENAIFKCLTLFKPHASILFILFNVAVELITLREKSNENMHTMCVKIVAHFLPYFSISIIFCIYTFSNCRQATLFYIETTMVVPIVIKRNEIYCFQVETRRENFFFEVKWGENECN